MLQSHNCEIRLIRDLGGPRGCAGESNVVDSPGCSLCRWKASVLMVIHMSDPECLYLGYFGAAAWTIGGLPWSAGFLNCGTIDILDQTILDCEELYSKHSKHDPWSIPTSCQ